MKKNIGKTSSSSSMAPSLSSLYTTLQNSSIIPFSPSFKTPSSLQFNFLKTTSKSNNTLTPNITHFKSRKTCATSPSLTLTSQSLDDTYSQHHWIVVVKAPPSQQAGSRKDVIDYYVKILEKVLGSDKEAQSSIYNASWDTEFSYCCEMDEETSKKLAGLPEVLSVKPDRDFNSAQKDFSRNIFSPLFPAGSSKHWLVRVQMPESRFMTRAQLVDYYTKMLTNVLGNEKDAQMCIYHVSLQSDYGFCCELDDECAKELAGVSGVISVRPDGNVDSDDKDYGGYNLQHSSDSGGSSIANQPSNIKTKKLFVTGLSFYTSEKTLRAAFEGFGELVEVKIIMDKISKRSKGFAFIEYTTEEAASEALKEMNGKIINGWMIVVDVAKTNPPKYSRGRPRPAS